MAFLAGNSGFKRSAFFTIHHGKCLRQHLPGAMSSMFAFDARREQCVDRECERWINSAALKI
jgi:hypothetical protein